MKLWSRGQVPSTRLPTKVGREACPLWPSPQLVFGLEAGLHTTRGCTLRDGASDVMLLLEVGAVLLRDGTAHESWGQRGQCHQMVSGKAGARLPGTPRPGPTRTPPPSLHHDLRPSKQAPTFPEPLLH